MTQPFYRFVDEHGEVHLVDSLARVPARYRDGVQTVDLAQATFAVQPGRPNGSISKQPGPKMTNLGTFIASLDVPSVLVGVGLSLVAHGGFSLIRRRGGPWLRGALLLGAVAVLSLGYIGWLRRTAGLGTSHWATPHQLVDDAKAAAEQMKVKLRRQQKALLELEDSDE